jgi:hypothetical protein
LPSIIPSYIYTLFASMIVGSLLIVTFSLSSINIKSEAEKQQLKTIAEYVATKSCELVSATAANKLAVNFTLDLPSLIGDQRYWVQLNNDSSVAWVETGYGIIPQPTDYQALIPSGISASGTYTSGSGPAVLQCQAQDAETHLSLSGGSK